MNNANETQVQNPMFRDTFGVEYCFLELHGLSVKVMYRLITPVGFGLWSEYTVPYERIMFGQPLSEIVEEQAKEQIKKDVQEIVAEEPSFATEEEAFQTMFQNFTVVELELVPKETK